MMLQILLLTQILGGEPADIGVAPKKPVYVEFSAEELEVLVPESGILFEPGGSSSYQEVLHGLLLANSTFNRECQMVVEQGYGGHDLEFSVFIERDRFCGGSPWVVKRDALKSINGAVAAALFDRKRPEGSSIWPYLGVGASDIAEHRARINEDTAEVLGQVCEMMLGTTRYLKRPFPAMHPDAAHFAHHDVEHGYRAGKTIVNRGRVGRFVKVLEQLGEVPTVPVEKRSDAEKRARESALVLIGELSKAGAEIPDFKKRRANECVPAGDLPGKGAAPKPVVPRR